MRPIEALLEQDHAMEGGKQNYPKQFTTNKRIKQCFFPLREECRNEIDLEAVQQHMMKHSNGKKPQYPKNSLQIIYHTIFSKGGG